MCLVDKKFFILMLHVTPFVGHPCVLGLQIEQTKGYVVGTKSKCDVLVEWRNGRQRCKFKFIWYLTLPVCNTRSPNVGIGCR